MQTVGDDVVVQIRMSLLESDQKFKPDEVLVELFPEHKACLKSRKSESNGENKQQRQDGKANEGQVRSECSWRY